MLHHVFFSYFHRNICLERAFSFATMYEPKSVWQGCSIIHKSAAISYFQQGKLESQRLLTSSLSLRAISNTDINSISNTNPIQIQPTYVVIPIKHEEKENMALIFYRIFLSMNFNI